MGDLFELGPPESAFESYKVWLGFSPRWEVDVSIPKSCPNFLLNCCIDSVLHAFLRALFMLVSALMGLDVMRAAYRHAIDEQYRFYSYGDASLLLP